MKRALLAVLAATAIVTAAATAAPAGEPGFKTSLPAMMMGAAPGVTYEKIISVGDTLPSGYRFESIPDGIAFEANGKGTVDLYVNHETSLVPFPVQGVSGAQTLHDFTNAMVSKLRLHQRSAGVMQGWYVIPSEANYQRFCSNFIASAEHGFERPLLLTNEEATDFVNRTGQAWPAGPGAEQAGVVVAYDLRSGRYRTIYGMGRHNHENSVAIPGYGHPVVLSGDDTFTSNPAQSQLYSYIAEDGDAVWNDEGDLYGLVLDDPNFRDYYDFPVGMTTGKSGTFVKIDKDKAVGDQTVLENESDRLGVFQFVRVEDIAYDRRPGMQNVVYVADSGRGASSPGNDQNGQPNPFTSTNGRVWKLVLDPANPTRVLSLSILIEGDDAPVKAPGEIHQPDNLETTPRSLLVQEDPGSSQQFPAGSTDPAATTARVWQYSLVGDFAPTHMRVVARVDQSADELAGVDRDQAPAGNWGAWESSGIIDASAVFGPGAFLLDVQAGTLIMEQEIIRPDGPDTDSLPDETREREGGQLGLLRVPGA